MAQPRGRPRSETARRAILAAAARLVAERGYGALTMEGIARSAGVSKQTVYRWWPRKSAVVLEALSEAAQAVAPDSDTGSLEADLRLFLRRTVTGAGQNAPMLAAMMAEAQLDEEFGGPFLSGFLARRRDVLREILERGRARGEVGSGADLDFVVEVAFAALWYRILGGHAPLNRRFADRLSQTVLALARG
jgi:AcrR family transcriptional regulator